MRTFTSQLLILLMIPFVGQSTIWTVDNNPGSPAQFTTIAAAVAAAAPNDTIYIQGSNTHYNGATAGIPLVFIGPGYAPPGDQTLPTILNTTLNLAPDSKVFGLTWSVGPGGVNLANNCELAFCYIRNINFQTSSTTNVSIHHNVILQAQINLGSQGNLNFYNNLFLLHPTGSSVFYQNPASPVSITNNVFVSQSTTNKVLANASNVIVANNIFYGAIPLDSTTVTNSQFSNNLTWNDPNNTPLPSGSNTGAGNLINQNPFFINVPTFTVSVAYDYHLSPLSPAKNAGTDGTDLGIYGGPFPAPDKLTGNILSYIKTLNILNPVVGPGDPIQIYFKAKGQ